MWCVRRCQDLVTSHAYHLSLQRCHAVGFEPDASVGASHLERELEASVRICRRNYSRRSLFLHFHFVLLLLLLLLLLGRVKAKP